MKNWCKQVRWGRPSYMIKSSSGTTGKGNPGTARRKIYVARSPVPICYTDQGPHTCQKISTTKSGFQITISTRELLSMAPDIRCQFKDQLIMKRVATMVFVETLAEEEPSEVLMANVTLENLIVAKHTEELRVIEVSIQGTKVVATVDNGFQIISIQQDIWEKLGLLIRSDQTMVMESANKTKDETMGLLQELRINIRGYDFYLQVQVVKDAIGDAVDTLSNR